MAIPEGESVEASDAWPDVAHAASSTMPPTVRPPGHGRRVGVALAVAVLALAVVAWAWSRTAPRPAMDLAESSDITLCAARLSPTDRDVVIGNLTFRPGQDVRVTAVALVDAVNVTLVDARTAAVAPAPDGCMAATVGPCS